MIAGGRVPAGEAGPMHVHQGDEVPRVLSGQILIRYRDRRRTARLVRREPCQAIPNVPIWTAAASRQAGVMPAQIRQGGCAAALWKVAYETLSNRPMPWPRLRESVSATLLRQRQTRMT